MCKTVVKWFPQNRIGNNLYQLIRAVIHCLNNSISTIIINRASIVSNNTIQLGSGCTCPKIVLESDYWPRTPKSPGSDTKKLSFNQRRDIIKKYIWPNLSIVFRSPPEHTLYIHIRSGLQFSQMSYATYYLQPPLAYYKKIINDGGYERINVVYQDKTNPCVDKLAGCHPNIHFYSSNGRNDFEKLCEAENLAIGFGTFGYAIAYLSPNIKKLYIPDYVNTHNIFKDNDYFQVEIINLPGYAYTRKIPNLKKHMVMYTIPYKKA